MQRRPSTQDITWLLDLHQNKQLDLNPPYQRRSVWSARDKQFFLDTIFRNYPSPAIFLHKTINEVGKATYHVVDGKQRTQTILDFIANKIRMPGDYGDVRLDSKKWRNLEGEQDLRKQFWNYQITVELIDFEDGSIIKEVFDRLNRNARKLTAQELRHAKYDGWFLTEVEAEAARDEWRTLGVVTTARARRMADSQFISELMLVVLEEKIIGFDQEVLDELYAKYEEPLETVPEFNEEEFIQRFNTAKAYVVEVERHGQIVSKHAKGVGNFYTLWSLIVLAEPSLPSPEVFAANYSSFMQEVELLASQQDLEIFLSNAASGRYARTLKYLNNSRGASTDLTQRQERLEALQSSIITS
jgi:hypothetical protein